MQEAGCGVVEAYVLRSLNTVVHYIDTRTILDLCEETAQRPGACVTKRWWDQEQMYLVKLQAAASYVTKLHPRSEELG